MSSRDTNDDKKKKKKQESIIEKELMAILYHSLNKCLNQALDEVLSVLNK